MRKLMVAVGTLSLLVGCNAQKASVPTSSNDAFQLLFAQSPIQKSQQVATQPITVVTKNRNIRDEFSADLFFYNVCKQSANQASQPAELNYVVARVQLETKVRACQSTAKLINRAWH